MKKLITAIATCLVVELAPAVHADPDAFDPNLARSICHDMAHAEANGYGVGEEATILLNMLVNSGKFSKHQAAEAVIWSVNNYCSEFKPEFDRWVAR